MSTHATAASESIDLPAREHRLALECGTIGIDQTGHEHRLRNRRGSVTIYVTPVGREEVVHVERLGDRPLTHWLDYVAARRGWLDCWATEDTGFEGFRRLVAARRYVQEVRR